MALSSGLISLQRFFLQYAAKEWGSKTVQMNLFEFWLIEGCCNCHDDAILGINHCLPWPKCPKMPRLAFDLICEYFS
ncbi:hypothetical protein HMPREF9371_0900 [Neisseria shayeganii 871]|uniref:Uncharacterized protein n=1 Tax=Neisseria shayeganii 871 TaxID=1032488 RepID=G4CH11_9NEIS|nr:hypothetical protein HMPREF9371_0900 [Neisseria shayeganii 871]